MQLLVAAEEFAGYLQRDLDRYTAETALAAASGLVRHYCRWPISAESTTFVQDGNGAQLLSLPTLRLNAVTAVRVGGVLLDPGQYEWSRGGQLYRNGAYWPARFRSVEADVEHGYAEVPDEVRAVVLALTTRYYVNPDGLRSKSVGAVSRTFGDAAAAGDLTRLEMSLIAGYRLP
jgi:hypothetical protein